MVSALVSFVMISSVGGIALGAPAMQNAALGLWLISMSITTFIAYLCVKFTGKNVSNARSGAKIGANTVAITFIIGTFIALFIFAEMIAYIILPILIFGGFSVMIGAGLGALIYGYGAKS